MVEWRRGLVLSVVEWRRGLVLSVAEWRRGLVPPLSPLLPTFLAKIKTKNKIPKDRWGVERFYDCLVVRSPIICPEKPLTFYQMSMKKSIVFVLCKSNITHIKT